LFVLNFNWVLTAGVLVGTGIMICYRDRITPLARGWFIALLLALAGAVLFHSRFGLWNNPRYVLPLLMLLLSAFLIVLAELRIRLPRLTAAGFAMYVLLLVSSHFHTIDPISKLVFGTFRFGEHEMLTSGGFRKLPYFDGQEYIGRDQLVYNFQFMKFSDLAEEAVRRFGLETQYVTGPAFTGWDDFLRFDERSMTRSVEPSAKEIKFTPIHSLSDDFKSGSGGDFVYLEFPNVLNEESLGMLKTHYDLQAVTTISLQGYSIRAYQFKWRGPDGPTT
jgi:hypothetical protein